MCRVKLDRICKEVATIIDEHDANHMSLPGRIQRLKGGKGILYRVGVESVRVACSCLCEYMRVLHVEMCAASL